VEGEKHSVVIMQHEGDVGEWVKHVVSVMCYFICYDTYTSAHDQVIDLKSIAGGMMSGLLGSGRAIPGKCHEGRISILN